MGYSLRLFICLILLVAPWLPSSLAHAQSTEDQLKSIFEQIIENQKAEAELDEEIGLSFDGDVVVEPIDDYYAITMPHIKVNYEDGDVLDIGIISINASEHDKDGQWKMSVAIPSKIALKDAAGSDIIRISSASQKAAGIWDETLQNFAKLEATYTDILVESSDPEFKMNLPAINIRNNLEQDTDGLWSGEYFVMSDGLKLSAKKNDTNLEIGETKMRVDIDRYDAEISASFKDTIAQLRSGDKNLSPDETAALADSIINTILTSGNGFTSNYSVSGINMSSKDKFGETSAFTFGKVNFGFDLTGFLNNDVMVALRASHNDFEVLNQKEQFKGFDPSNSNIDIKLQNIPITDVLNTSRNVIKSIAQNPDTAAMAGLSLILKIPAILSQAKTKLSIADSFISSDEYKVTLDGNVIADITAANSATGEANAKFFGLDKILAKAQVLADNPDTPDKARFDEIRRKLLMLKSIGKVETAQDGQFYHSYNFIMDPKGQMLLNGQDVRTLGAKPAPAIQDMENAQ